MSSLYLHSPQLFYRLKQNAPDNPADSLLFLRKLPWNPTRDFNKLKQTVNNFVTFAEGVIDQQTSTYKSGQIRGFVDMMISGNEKAGKLLFDKPTQIGLFLNLLNAGT